MIEDEMVGWHHRQNGHGFGWTLGVGDGRHGMLWFMGCQRVGHDLVTELNLTELYGCESWTIKKAEHQRIDAFELWCWGGLLRVPWIAKRSNQSILKEISPECSLEGLMLKLQYFGHLMRRTNSLEKP